VTIPFEEPTSIGRPFVDLSPEIAAAILLTIQGGWQIARKRSEANSAAGEVALTECLREGMRDALEGGLPWGRAMIVAPGTESKSRTGLLRPDGLTDIPLYLIEVFLSTRAHDPHAIIECKRVADGNAALVREYVLEGIDRFRTGKYAANHGVAFMAGYVISGAAGTIVGAINTFLDRDGRPAERLYASALIASEDLWASEHERPNYSAPIHLHHAMLRVEKMTGIAAARATGQGA
jgi:hypothetical protein